jgi:transposase-like protein
MKTRKKTAGSPRRERRAFPEEFKQEAVRLLHERRANGVTVTQVGRELDVRPDQLREWALRLAKQEVGLAAAGVIETPEQELQRLRREVVRLREEQAFAKKVAVYFARESR